MITPSSVKAAVLWIEKFYCLQARHNSICIAASLPSVPQKHSAQDQCKICSELVSDSSTSYEKTRTCTTHSKGHYSKQEIPVHLLWRSKAEVPSSQCSVSCTVLQCPLPHQGQHTPPATGQHWGRRWPQTDFFQTHLQTIQNGRAKPQFKTNKQTKPTQNPSKIPQNRNQI